MSEEVQVFKKTGADLKPDPKFNSLLVSKFINCLMLDGKKSIASSSFYTALDIVATKIKDDTPLTVFEKAIDNIKPAVEVKSKRVGGATYQVPVEVPRKRQQTLAFRWMLEAARAKKGQKIAKALANEFMDAYNKQGTAVTKRTNVHKMAEANKAFAHFG